ncbi:hypothetical protein Pla100_35690 [Neorhodopirellula pilleata]|uniref:Uncharacterized protein n=2 Tax=Neorhodopirellula pilleata TaxID=2714738 RepID=A0A5C6A6G9_9BACT|nr:hypothetical protein Pla100_35690 [Neorhodopirellula pilleata]
MVVARLRFILRRHLTGVQLTENFLPTFRRRIMLVVWILAKF